MGESEVYYAKLSASDTETSTAKISFTKASKN